MLTFLIIEDDESQRLMLKSILKKHFNCEIKTAENGKDGLEALKQEIPSIILMDLDMPVMSGPEFLKLIREVPAYKNIPVLVISANNDRNIIGSLVDKGIYDYILKPVEINSTVNRINRVLTKVLSSSEADAARTESINLASKPKLLLVENDKFQRELVIQLLSDRFFIQDVKNGMDALALYEKMHHRYILLSDKVELLDKKIVTQKIREVAQDNELSIYLMYTDIKTITTKIFNFDGLIKRSIDAHQFKEEILKVLPMNKSADTGA